MLYDRDKNGEVTTEEFNACINAKDSKTGQDIFTEEQKKEKQEMFEKMDANNDGKITTTEEIKYDLQNGKESISQEDLKSAYGEKKASEMMKYDKDGDGRLNAKEFDEATKKKSFLDKINFKDPKVILATIGIAATIIGLIVGLYVLLSRKSKKEKEKQEQSKMEQQLQNISQSTQSTQSTSVSSGNLAEKAHTFMSSQIQQQSNDTFSQYSQSSINNTQQPLSLNDNRRSNDIGR